MWQIAMRASICVAALWLAVACDPKVAERGRQDLLVKAGNVIPHQMNKRDVSRMLGTPSSRSHFGDDSWYYISGRKETVAFFEPEVTDQAVLRITFDGDVVETVEYYDKAQAVDVAISDRETPTSGQEYGFFEQLIGNIGRFNNRRDPLSGGGGRPGPG